MNEFAADPSHPRYKSLLMRHKLENAAKKGLLAESALIAHGRGEAFDYLIGECTTSSAMKATNTAVAHLIAAKNPIISLNGNSVALAGENLLKLAEKIGCPVEVNIFYRTEKRMNALISYLENIKSKLGLSVEILGSSPDMHLPGLEGPRAKCVRKGIGKSDVVLVPLEDGDRCKALVSMGKFVIVIDLNPLSRSAKSASVTIVDELTRVAENMHKILPMKPMPEPFKNQMYLENALNTMVKNASEMF